MFFSRATDRIRPAAMELKRFAEIIHRMSRKNSLSIADAAVDVQSQPNSN
jgi:hypothetical protein